MYFRLMRGAGAGKYCADLLESELNNNEYEPDPFCDPLRFIKRKEENIKE